MSTRRIVLGLAVAAVLSVATVCCIRHGEEAERASAAQGAASSGDAVVAQPSAAAPALSELARERDAGARDAAPEPRADEPKPPPQDNAVARAMRATDANDRALLADIERQTKKAPPPAVHALLALRKEGKSRAELERFIAAELKGDVVVRMLAMRWLDGRKDEATAPRLRGADELDGPRQLQPITSDTP